MILLCESKPCVSWDGGHYSGLAAGFLVRRVCEARICSPVFSAGDGGYAARGWIVGDLKDAAVDSNLGEPVF